MLPLLYDLQLVGGREIVNAALGPSVRRLPVGHDAVAALAFVLGREVVAHAHVVAHLVGDNLRYKKKCILIKISIFNVK